MTADEWSWQRLEPAVERLLAGLDWRQLGEIYFHSDGVEHWQQRRPQLLEFGLQWARELLRRLPAAGRSLYVGAGVAELPALLAERLLRGREVVAVNLRARECELLAAGLQRAGFGDCVRIEPRDAHAAAAAGHYDHLACVSLFTDPESWPILSDFAYGRIAAVQFDVEAFAAERQSARSLAAALFAGLTRPGLITTTAEELAWFLEPAAQAGAPWDADEQLIPTAVVGDPIGFVRIG